MTPTFNEIKERCDQLVTTHESRQDRQLLIRALELAAKRLNELAGFTMFSEKDKNDICNGLLKMSAEEIAKESCEQCNDKNGPRHEASDGCGSGKQSHCACDICF